MLPVVWLREASAELRYAVVGQGRRRVGLAGEQR